ncbi:hypothetical protein EPK97_16575 [Chengkuizengella sediminis]|nr:hypothetical protein [Chengkuizengella sediminis]
MLRRVDRLELNIIQYFLTQGPFAVLFVWLLIYVMKNGKERVGYLFIPFLGGRKIGRD